MSGLEAILETLSARCRFDSAGRMRSTVDGGVLPRFVLGRSEEGCVWRFRHDLTIDAIARLADLAGRERGVSFEGELPAPPERLAALLRLLPEANPRASGDRQSAGVRREVVTRAGVVVGELWWFEGGG